MKAWHVLQGSDEWRRLRLGIPTSSCFDKIVTPTGRMSIAKDGKGFSQMARKYAHQLVAETLLGRPLDDDLDGLRWITRGKDLEPDAAKLYELMHGVRTLPVGFITNDAGTVGCSPDRLIEGLHAGLEIKCPAPNTHVGYMIDGFEDYAAQIQGQLYIAEFEWVDRMAFHPELAPVIVRTYRNEPFIKGLAEALDAFLAMKADMLAQARAAGALPDFGGSGPLNVNTYAGAA